MWHIEELICVVLLLFVVIYVLSLLLVMFLLVPLSINSTYLFLTSLLHFVLKLLVFELLVASQLFFQLLVVHYEFHLIVFLSLLIHHGSESLVLDLIDFLLNLFLLVLVEQGLHSLFLRLPVHGSMRRMVAFDLGGEGGVIPTGVFILGGLDGMLEGPVLVNVLVVFPADSNSGAVSLVFLFNVYQISGGRDLGVILKSRRFK